MCGTFSPPHCWCWELVLSYLLLPVYLLYCKCRSNRLGGKTSSGNHNQPLRENIGLASSTPTLWLARLIFDLLSLSVCVRQVQYRTAERYHKSISSPILCTTFTLCVTPISWGYLFSVITLPLSDGCLDHTTQHPTLCSRSRPYHAPLFAENMSQRRL